MSLFIKVTCVHVAFKIQKSSNDKGSFLSQSILQPEVLQCQLVTQTPVLLFCVGLQWSTALTVLLYRRTHLFLFFFFRNTLMASLGIPYGEEGEMIIWVLLKMGVRTRQAPATFLRHRMSPVTSFPPTVPHQGSGKHCFSPSGTSLSSP